MNTEQTLKQRIEHAVLSGRDRLFSSLCFKGERIENVRDAIEELIDEGRLAANGRFICAPLPDWVVANKPTWLADAGQLIYCRDNPLHRPDHRDRYQYPDYLAYCDALSISPH